MLVLTRKLGEEIVLGVPGQSQVIVRVVDITANRVRLMFEAPDDLEVNRREVYDLKYTGKKA